MIKQLSYSLAFVVLFGIVVAFATYMWQAQTAFGSVQATDEYFSTTTAANGNYGAISSVAYSIRRNTLPVQGSLGSVVITGAGTGVMNFYDATTTSVLLRAANMPTSTILLASFPVSAAANTYTFDIIYRNGLTYDVTVGAVPTTTITYR